MNVVEVVIPYKLSDGVFSLFAGGDEHLAIKHCSESSIRRYVSKIKATPFSRWVGMGDKGEFITPSDPRWDAGVIADWLDPEDIGYTIERKYEEFYSPVKETCIGLVKGNHEYSMQAHNHERVHEHICERLGVRDLGYSAFIRLIFRRKGSREAHSFLVYVAHGSGSAITKGAKVNKLQRIMDGFEADIYAVGHMHELITDSKPYLTLNSNNTIVERRKVGAVTGCYFQTYKQDVSASYGERKGYPPTAIGSAVFEINPGTGAIDVHRVQE